MDPLSVAGLALGVAALAGQVFTGCVQGIQFIVTAKNLPEDSKYLNLRLRMEQQRLFAWSETSGLLEYQNSDDKKVRESNTFIIHRTTILDLLVQIQCLFKEFEKAQSKNGHLKVALEAQETDSHTTKDPAEESSSAHVPLSETRRKFIIKAMNTFRASTSGNIAEGKRRLWWAAFDKRAFEELLGRFAILNDNMTDILDARLQTEIHRTTQDTNRGVLQLHKDLTSLRQLVMALDIRSQVQSAPLPDASGVRLLAQLAKFKAFNESLDTEGHTPWDEATAMILQYAYSLGTSTSFKHFKSSQYVTGLETLMLGHPDAEKARMKIDRANIDLKPSVSDADSAAIRCEATFIQDGVSQPVWIEWKEYDYQKPGSESLPPLIVERVQRLASLLHHEPKPEAFRVPRCLGYFDNAKPNIDADIESDEEDDLVDARIGFVFEKPKDEGLSPNTSPISLFELLSSSPKPRVTDRVRLSHAIANCLLYLHTVNWLHKGLRSHNIVFFPTSVTSKKGSSNINYSKPYLSGFDFSRPARADEMTEVPGDIPAYNMYRHPNTQGQGFGPRESFRKSFDIYSFGVVLVEIAHWATIDKVLGMDMGKMSMTTKVRGMLLDKKRIADVGANMGEMYETATCKCIAGGTELGIGDNDDEKSDAVASKLSMAFYEDVVKKLGDVRV